MIASLSVTLRGNGIKSETAVGITVKIRTGIGLRSATMIAIMSMTGSIIATLVLTGITTPVTDAPITVLRKMRLGKWLIGRSTRGGAAAIVVIGANSYFSLFQYGT